jgi:hypothetical protein
MAQLRGKRFSSFDWGHPVQKLEWDPEVFDRCVEGLAALGQRCTRSHCQVFKNHEQKIVGKCCKTISYLK